MHLFPLPLPPVIRSFRTKNPNVTIHLTKEGYLYVEITTSNDGATFTDHFPVCSLRYFTDECLQALGMQ